MLISELPKDVRLKALEYQKLYPNKKKDQDSIWSFWWHKTPEDHDYWNTLHKAIFIDNGRPAHYDNGTNKDVIDFCHDNNINFCRGSAIKYIVRAGKKDDEIDDLKKAIDFLQREIKELER